MCTWLHPQRHDRLAVINGVRADHATSLHCDCDVTLFNNITNKHSCHKILVTQNLQYACLHSGAWHDVLDAYGQCTIGVFLFRYIEGYHLLELNYVFQDMAQMQSALGQDLNAHEPEQTLASPSAVTAVKNVTASGRSRPLSVPFLLRTSGKGEL